MSEHGGDGKLDRVLDAALHRALAPPALRKGVRSDLITALRRLEHADPAPMRERLEHEHRARLAALEMDFVRVRRSTLATLIGVAFAAGAATAIALPWLRAQFGPDAPMAIAWGGAAAGLGIVITSLRGGLGAGAG